MPEQGNNPQNRDRRRDEILAQAQRRADRRRAQKDKDTLAALNRARITKDMRKAELADVLLGVDQLYREYPKLSEFVPILREYLRGQSHQTPNIGNFFEEALAMYSEGTSMEFMGALHPQTLFDDYHVVPQDAAASRLFGHVVGVRMVNTISPEIDLEPQAMAESRKVVAELGVDPHELAQQDKSHQQVELDKVVNVHNILNHIHDGTLSFIPENDLREEPITPPAQEALRRSE